MKNRDRILELSGGISPEAALGEGRVTFIGTATVLLEAGGYRILTDPNFLHKGQRIPLGFGLHATRKTNPALEIQDLPPLDLAIVSHLHADHFDRVAQVRLPRSLPLVTPRQAARTLRRRGFRAAQGLRTWESIDIRKLGASSLRITAMPARHARGPLHWMMPPVIGTLLQFGNPPNFTLYISGDTLMVDEIAKIPEWAPDIDMALIHLGGTRILGLLVTMDDRQGLQMLQLINPKTAIPIHYDDYTVFKSPLSDFLRSVQAAGLSEKLRVLNRGDQFSFSIPQPAPFRPSAVPVR